jgi:hypothetical protein
MAMFPSPRINEVLPPVASAVVTSTTQGVSSGHNDVHNIAPSNFGFVPCYDSVLVSNVALNADVQDNKAGVGLEAGLSVSLGHSKTGSTAEALSVAMGNVASMGMKGSVGVASSPLSSGKPVHNAWTSPSEVKSKVCLSLIENSSDNMAVCPTMEEVIAFGGIPQPSLDVRTSARLGGQPGGDMFQMEKAMRNAQLRDGSSTLGKSLPPKFSIVNIPDDEIMHKVERLGISLGKSNGEVVKSIKGIKLLEEERILTILQKNIDENVNKEEDPSTLVMSKVSTLCDDLVEDDCIPLDLDDHLEHLKPVIKEKKTRVRKIYDTNNIRKGTRRRIKRQFS